MVIIINITELVRQLLEADTILPEQVQFIQAAHARDPKEVDFILQVAYISQDICTLDFLMGPGKKYLSEEMRVLLKRAGYLDPTN